MSAVTEDVTNHIVAIENMANDDLNNDGFIGEPEEVEEDAVIESVVYDNLESDTDDSPPSPPPLPDGGSSAPPPLPPDGWSPPPPPSEAPDPGPPQQWRCVEQRRDLNGEPPPPNWLPCKVSGTNNSDEIIVKNQNFSGRPERKIIIYGHEGDDFAYGYKGDDTIKGHQGNDYLKGGCGNDKLQGCVGDDTSKGGNGNDFLCSGSGNDVLLGGAGSDTFKIYGFGENIIKDFTADDGDRIILKASHFGSIAQDGEHVLIAFDDNSSILVYESSLSDVVNKLTVEII